MHGAAGNLAGMKQVLEPRRKRTTAAARKKRYNCCLVPLVSRYKMSATFRQLWQTEKYL